MVIRMPRIKRWRKVKSRKYEILYLNNEEDTLVQIVSNPCFSGWYVLIYKSKSGSFSHSNIILTDKFKTKTQALKFAINWMKKHPGG